MATIEIELARRALVLTADGERFAVPLSHVVGATADRQALAALAGRLRREAPPAMLTGALAVHTARTREGDWAFWEAQDLSHAVAIHLAGERVALLVVAVDDPRATAEAITAAIRGAAMPVRAVATRAQAGAAA